MSTSAPPSPTSVPPVPRRPPPPAAQSAVLARARIRPAPRVPARAPALAVLLSPPLPSIAHTPFARSHLPPPASRLPHFSFPAVPAFSTFPTPRRSRSRRIRCFRHCSAPRRYLSAPPRATRSRILAFLTPTESRHRVLLVIDTASFPSSKYAACSPPLTAPPPHLPGVSAMLPHPRLTSRSLSTPHPASRTPAPSARVLDARTCAVSGGVLSTHARALFRRLAIHTPPPSLSRPHSRHCVRV
ncbi:hypothetical protein B0H11DRAFT_2213730 [Mycena galericulata]|nr:hypothetical protein B0H11DRAFT_2213730 [Mycena galericulata]